MKKQNVPVEWRGRGSGRTTKQMQEAPQGAVFIWCDKYIDYPKRLAAALGREDLRIVSASVLTDHGPERLLSMQGYSMLDHALETTPQMRDFVRAVNSRQVAR